MPTGYANRTCKDCGKTNHVATAWGRGKRWICVHCRARNGEPFSDEVNGGQS